MKITMDRQYVEYPKGLEISVSGFKGDNSEEPAQVFIEVYEGKLRIHVWDGNEDPCTSVEVEPLEEVAAT